MKNTGWICPKCGRVYAPFIMECSHCNNNEIKPDPCLITLPWTQDYSKYKSEIVTDTYKSNQDGTIDGKYLECTTSHDFNRYTSSQETIGSQMICDSQGCREVDLFGRPIKPVLETLMSPEQLEKLANREHNSIQNSDEHPKNENTHKSSFEVMLEDDDSLPTKIEVKEHLYYINHTTTPENENSKYEWVCGECDRKYYKFPTMGCLCGAKLDTLCKIEK